MAELIDPLGSDLESESDEPRSNSTELRQFSSTAMQMHKLGSVALSPYTSRILRYLPSDTEPNSNVKKFHQAAFIGRLGVLGELYKADKSLVAATVSVATKFLPIHTACRSKRSVNTDAKIVESLIEWYVEYQDTPEEEKMIDKDSRLSCTAAGKIALHLACKSNKPEVVDILLLHEYKYSHHYHEILMLRQLEAQTERLKNTALHIATYENNVEIVDRILTKCSFDKALLKAVLGAQNIHGDTAVHIAAARGCLKILRLFYDEAISHSINCFGQGGHGDSSFPSGRHGWSVLHTACAYNQLEAVKQIISLTNETSDHTKQPLTHGVLNMNYSFDITVNDVKELITSYNGCQYTSDHLPRSEEMTPLTLACIFGHAEIVEYLLSEGAELKKPAFLEAVDRSHEECLRQLVIWSGNYDELKTHLSLNNSKATSFDQQNPLQYDGGSKSSLTTHNYRDVGTIRPSASTEHGNLLSHIIEHMPSVAETVMDKCVVMRFKKETQRKMYFQYKNVKTVTMNYDLISINRVNRFTSKTHPLQTMVEKGDEKLLKHPLIASFVYNNWNSKCGLIYLIYLFIYMVFLAFTNTLLFRLPHPTSSVCVDKNDTTLETAVNDDPNGFLMSSSSVINLFLASCMLFYSSIRLLFFEGQQFISAIYKELYHKPRDEQVSFNDFYKLSYFRDLSNWVEVPLLVLSIIFSIIVFMSSTRSYCLFGPEWQIGVTIICLSWIELILLSKQFHFIGIQAVTFGQVLKTVFQFLPFAFLLIAAFGLSMHLLLHQPNLMGSAFYTPYYSLIYTYTLISGEISTNNVFKEFNGELEFAKHLQFEIFTSIFWCISVFFITIGLTNVMIGLAVSDIQRVYSKADLQRLKVQIAYILEVNELNSGRKFCNHHKACVFVYDKMKETYNLHKHNFWEKIRKIFIGFLWGCKHFNSEKEIYTLHSRQVKWPTISKLKKEQGYQL